MDSISTECLVVGGGVIGVAIACEISKNNVNQLKDKDGKYTVMPNAKTNPENFAAPGTLNSRMAFDEEKKVTGVV